MLHSAHNQVNTANKKLTNWDSTSDLLLFRCMKNAKKTYNVSQQQPGLSTQTVRLHEFMASILDIRNTGSLIHVCSFLFSSFGSSALCPLQVQISALRWLEIISVIDSIVHDEQHSSFQMCSWFWVNQKSWLRVRRLLPGVISWQLTAHY